MNTTRLFATLLLAAVAATGYSQTSPPTDDTKAGMNTPAPVPPTADQARGDVANQKQDPLAMQTSGAQDWNSLSGHDKGYVTRSDALPNSWLATNFSNCDKDQDGKVNESEYDQCRDKHE